MKFLKMALFSIYSLLSVLLLSGCLYQNSCGYSNSAYSEKRSYYDSQGNYKEVCPPDNTLYFEDIKNNPEQEFQDLEQGW